MSMEYFKVGIDIIFDGAVVFGVILMVCDGGSVGLEVLEVVVF